jgi:hypothetical protein
MPKLITTHPDVTDREPVWSMIRACVIGQRAVKELGDKLLPRPNASDTSQENQDRYALYLERAVFYNITGRTLRGLVGYVFAKEPVVTLPQPLQALEADIDGAGTTLDQQAKRTLGAALSLGRCGLLVDYPAVEEGKVATKQDQAAGAIRPTVIFYEPEDIRDWRCTAIGAESVLVSLTLRERGLDAEGKVETKFRLFTIEGSAVRVRVVQETGENGDEVILSDTMPKDSTGAVLTRIPFLFVGAETNDSSVDEAPLADLAELNVAHYRNSADHEESCYLISQPTLAVAGLTEAWVKDILKGKILIGSRSAVLLPQGGSAMLLQVSPNTMTKEAMEHKERMMVALGAKLVEQKEVQRTATEASMEHAGEVSTLTSCAANVFAAYKKAFTFAGIFAGATNAEIDYDLSEPLALTPLAADQANALIALFQGQLIDFEEARFNLKKSGVAWKDDQEVRDNNAAEGFNQPPDGTTTPPDGSAASN